MRCTTSVLVAVVLVLVPCVCARADGVFVWNKGVDLYEPSQKAVILWDKGVEDLILQVKYEGPAADFAWVVPLPSRPEVCAVDGDVFAELSEYTQKRDWWYANHALGTAGEGLTGGVDVLERRKVGVYDVATLNADSVTALVDWLDENGYHLPPKARLILDDYIERKWTFVAIRIHPDEEKLWVEKALNKGTLVPLKFTFPSEEVVYPLKISSLNKGETEVLLYVFYGDAVVHPDFVVQAPHAFNFWGPAEQRFHQRWQERLPEYFDATRYFFRAVRDNELPLCREALPRLSSGGFFLSKLRNTFRTEEMQFDVVLKTVEQLGERERYYFIKKQVENPPRHHSYWSPNDEVDPWSKARNIYWSSLFVRAGDQLFDYVGDRVRDSERIGRNGFALMSKLDSPRATDIILTAASHSNARMRSDLAYGLRTSSRYLTLDPTFIPVLRSLLEAEVSVHTVREALRIMGTDEARAVLDEFKER